MILEPDGSWNVHTLGNAGVALFLGAAAWFLATQLSREPWRTARRQIRGRPSALVALGVLGLYVAVGLADSVAWRDARTGPDGKPLLDAEGRPLLEARGLSLLDRACAPLRERREKTYSAPLAETQSTREMTQGPDGRSRWSQPPLKHPGSHLLGTDRIGDDVLYRSLKGVRTGLMIGGLTILIAIPIAVTLGVVAGYWGGWVDVAIQYLYSVVASIPFILLIVAFLMFARERSLALICAVLGISSWTHMCRLVRAETLKLREMEYVQSARVAGASRLRVLARHIVPNLAHIVIISSVLLFSQLVLYEAVLAYIGVGVGGDVGSWGNMITISRLELSRDPVIWWNLVSAFIFMFGMVLSANLFGDALRDALDPRLRQR